MAELLSTPRRWRRMKAPAPPSSMTATKERLALDEIERIGL
jgi:hypothetical protein